MNKRKIHIFSLILIIITCFANVLAFSQTITRQFIDVDVDINVSAYIPTISGTISCIEGKVINIVIRNKTDNTIIKDDTITSETGTYNLNCVLPSLLSSKVYEVSMTCVEGETTLASMSVEIDSAVLLVEVNGTISTADNVNVSASVQSTNTGLIDKSTNFTGNKNVSVNIPNLVASANFHLVADGYETVNVTLPETDNDIEVLVSNVGKIVNLQGATEAGENKQVTILVTDSDDKIVYIDQIKSGANGVFSCNFELMDDVSDGVCTLKVGGDNVQIPTALTFTYIGTTNPDTPDNPVDEEIPTISYSVAKISDDDFKIILTGTNISSFNSRIFKLTYNTEELAPTSYFGLGYEDVTECGNYGNVNIISDNDGEIKFNITNIQIPENKAWSGILNVFEFRFLEENGGISQLLFSETE